jgi:hypothetical protein
MRKIVTNLVLTWDFSWISAREREILVEISRYKESPCPLLSLIREQHRAEDAISVNRMTLEGLLIQHTSQEGEVFLSLTRIGDEVINRLKNPETKTEMGESGEEEEVSG